MKLAAAALIAAAFVCSPARAATTVYNDPPTPAYSCTFQRVGNTISSIAALPQPIANFITTEVGPMADRGKAFNNGDAPIPSLPFARFILAGQIPKGWFVWYEQGGANYSQHVVILGNNTDGTLHMTADALVFPPTDLCSTTEHLESDPTFSNGGKLY
jgi:hypothetical protein